ncbi:nitroreductase family protein [Thioalkalivibrio sulfidiphilus]|uniref:nitroreductase family protein n=1 Tax=Thioalkalivibrio sulfidiphilus TaxID=1033854 RepID=UPI0003696951|nr:nitroreductase family protein [Thioalkalivibrio sulfidiphilus]
MWDFFKTVRHRHSVRRYQADMPVEDEKLHAILETAIAAPSAGDLQAYVVVAVRDAALRAALARAAHDQAFIAEAPVVLVFCTEAERSARKYGERGRDLFALQDATIACAYAQLAVVAAGLGSTWVGYFDEAQVAEQLDLPETQRPIALLCVGYPAELPEVTPRRRLDELVIYK